MNIPEDPQPFLSFPEPNSHPRQPSGIAASIWAPQALSADTTWTKALDAFSGAAEKSVPKGLCSDLPLRPYPTVTREDVFGPVGAGTNGAVKNVGAIGEGRRKNESVMDDAHIFQLLRTLNLNSPAPLPQSTSLSHGVDLSPSSPDFSPISTTSPLLTPTDLSPSRSFDLKFNIPYDLSRSSSHLSQSPLLIEPNSPKKLQDSSPSNILQFRPTHVPPFHNAFSNSTSAFIDKSPDNAFVYTTQPARRPDSTRGLSMTWRAHQQVPNDWSRQNEVPFVENNCGLTAAEDQPRYAFTANRSIQGNNSVPTNSVHSHEPINFLSLLQPSSSPPYHVFVERIIKFSDQQASIFLQQKLKVADLNERAKIVDAICTRGFEMMAHRFGNWAVQRCLEASAPARERRKIVQCMRGRIVELATNCYGCHVLQKALDCEEDIRLLIVSELLIGEPAKTLVNKHASHVWSKIMELTWTPPAPPIFEYVNKSLKGKWASLACHETGSLVVQHAFENLEDTAKEGIVDELLNQGQATFGEVATSQWGSYCIQHILEHGSEIYRKMTIDLLISGLLEYTTNEQGSKSVMKALREGGRETLDKIVKRMCEPAPGGRRPMIVDLALSVTGSQLIASVLPGADKDQRALLYDCIRGHVVTLRGGKTGSKVIWLFDKMRAYYGY